MGTDKGCCSKLTGFRPKALAGLADRSSRPQRLRQPDEPGPSSIRGRLALRRQRLPPGQHIATGRRGLARQGQPHPQAPRPEPPHLPRAARAGRRYDDRRRRDHPLDIKKLAASTDRPPHHRLPPAAEQRSRGEGAGWEFVHVAIDDASRIAPPYLAKREKRRALSPSSWPPSPTTRASA